MTNSSSPFTFLVPTSEAGVDVFDLWTPASLPSASVETWRADLPDDPDEAARMLDERSAQVRAIHLALPTAQARLEHDLSGLSRGAGLSFSIDGTGNGARSILAAGLRYQDPSVSFGLLDGLKIDPFQLKETAGLVTRFSDQVRSTVSQLSLVETLSGGRKAGLSRASWTGDVQTWWSAGAGREQRLQHQQVIEQVLATRQAWLRILCLVAGGVTRVAATLAAGPFSLISIWTTWNYLREIVKEVRGIHAGLTN